MEKTEKHTKKEKVEMGLAVILLFALLVVFCIFSSKQPKADGSFSLNNKDVCYYEIDNAAGYVKLVDWALENGYTIMEVTNNQKVFYTNGTTTYETTCASYKDIYNLCKEQTIADYSVPNFLFVTKWFRRDYYEVYVLNSNLFFLLIIFLTKLLFLLYFLQILVYINFTS